MIITKADRRVICMFTHLAVEPGIPQLTPLPPQQTRTSSRVRFNPSLRRSSAARATANSRAFGAVFAEGVLVAKKDFNAPKHAELDVKNLHVIKACQSLTSRGYLTTQFSWQYYYVRWSSAVGGSC